MTPRLPLRARVAVSLLTVAALLLTAGLLQQFAVGRLLRVGSVDRITEYERRFAPLKALLPAHGTVGYLTSSPADTPSGTAQRSASLFLTQYTLAPLVVVNDPAQPLVVANLMARQSNEPLVIPADLELVRDFENGVALFRRRSP